VKLLPSTTPIEERRGRGEDPFKGSPLVGRPKLTVRKGNKEESPLLQSSFEKKEGSFFNSEVPLVRSGF